eukprot:gene397-10064_t
MGRMQRLTLCILQVLAVILLVEGSCDISTCSVVIYRDCQAAPACGSRNGFSCSYISQGISTSACAWNPCTPVIGNGNWQSVCGGIDAIDIKGPCKAQLAQQSNGGLPYTKIFQPGFHGVWQTFENGVHFGDRVLSVKMSCADGVNTVVCDTNWMLIYLDSRFQMSNGTVVTLRHSNCTAKKYVPVNRYGLITAFNDCGTTKRETMTHIVYENEVIWTFGGNGGTISRLSGKRISYSCSFSRHADTNNAIIRATTSFLTASEAGYGNFSVSLEMFNGSDFTKPVGEFPQEVKLNQRIHFQAKVKSNDSDIAVLIEKCIATPTMDMNHPSSHTLIKDRCSFDSTVQFHPTQDLQYMRFSFDSFAFVGKMNQVYLHCQIFMCHKTSTDSRCSSGCRGNNVRRLRRSLTGVKDSTSSNHDLAESETENSMTLNYDLIASKVENEGLHQSKRIQKRDVAKENFPPSKTYDLNLGPLKTSENSGAKKNNQNSADSGKFTSTHGLILGVALLGMCVVALVGKPLINKRLKISKAWNSKKANELKDGSNVNNGYEMEATA